VKPSRKPLDWFLGALAVFAAIGVLFRRSRSAPMDAAAEQAASEVTTRQWAGSFLQTIRTEIRDDETVIVAAAVAFYAMLAMVPAAIAAISIYGLVLDPSDLANQIDAITDALPASANALVTEQVERLAAASNTGLGVGVVVSILGALWVASGGTRSLLHGVNIVYNVEERRPWLIQRAIAYGLTLGFIIFGVGTIAVVTFLPDWLENLGFGITGVRVIEIARWPAIFVVVVLGLVVLYRIGPNRPNTREQRLFPGALAAAFLWMLATAGFSIYTGTGFSSFTSETYGILVQVVVLLVWFFASGFVILLGAEVNASLETNGRP
jgi:membrane protein